ncbi:MAG TPA: DUF4160 domain-containing protein [Xanthobacteraceae bacterium]|nr:DUF4160 domain-containing protein [Xanthobacteraceae bacterium]
MPTVAYFLGMAVAMYYRDHDPPHVHVYYQGYKALFAIEDARIIRGRFPPTATLIMRRWIVQRREPLLLNWKRLKRHEPLDRIAGPDEDDHRST